MVIINLLKERSQKKMLIVVNGLRKSFKDLTVFDVHSNGVSVSLYKHTNLKTVLLVLCFEPILKLYRLMLST
jgi:hypothetical protein